MLLTLKTGEKIKIELADPDREPSVFALSLQKAGSVLLDNIIADLAIAARRPAVNLSRQCFALNAHISQLAPRTLDDIFSRSGYIFFGFRQIYHPLTDAKLSNNHKVLLVRDPRDMLVSYYFSMAKSHAVPETGEVRNRILKTREAANSMDINEFVLSGFTTDMAKHYQRYVDFHKSQKSVKTYRYEDVIFSKRSWVRSMAKYLELKIRDSLSNAIADKYDVWPDIEDPDKHVRQVFPGNHRKYLTPDVIYEIERRYQLPMEYFGYLCR